MSAEHELFMPFGRTVRALRLKACLSQEGLASLAGIDRSYLGAVERGEHNVSLKNILKIAGALSVHPSELFAKEENNGC